MGSAHQAVVTDAPIRPRARTVTITWSPYRRHQPRRRRLLRLSTTNTRYLLTRLLQATPSRGANPTPPTRFHLAGRLKSREDEEHERWCDEQIWIPELNVARQVWVQVHRLDARPRAYD